MRRRPRQPRLLVMVAIAGFIVVALTFGWLRPVQSVIAGVFAPLTGAASGAGSSTSGLFSVVGEIATLQKQNQELRSENADLRQRLSDDAELRAQNESLRKQLNVAEIQPNRLVGAQVIGYQPDNLRQFITINRGSKDGIQQGMAVVSEGSLVGTVSEVSGSTSKIFLVTDPNFRVAAIDQDQEARPDGTVRGQIGGGLIMEKIAQNQPVKVGDTVVTSGLGGQMPKGIVIGRVAAVSTSDNAVFQTAQLSTGLTFSRLELVYVVARP